MSKLAAVTFNSNGSDELLKEIYDSLNPISIDLDVGCYHQEKTGIIEFVIDEYEIFEKAIELKSKELNIPFETLRFWPSEERPNESE